MLRRMRSDSQVISRLEPSGIYCPTSATIACRCHIHPRPPYKPLLNSTSSNGTSWNRSSSFFGEMLARDGKAAMAGGRKTRSDRPIRPAARERQRKQGPAEESGRTNVRDGVEPPAVRAVEDAALLEERHDDGREDEGGAVSAA